ncbi:hypothetical protein [Nostoc sp. LPT]|uniref:hypothetical protein n=1 Tax=Nostoc sp. LPT TaxID=2815387 RepID=UPI001D7A9FC7|nr:hypothetical protein [Nostoc sp. LPT]MBN4001279.1 hypothetical protein [Nostoc sp. LPT]
MYHAHQRRLPHFWRCAGADNGTTKGKADTRSIPVCDKIREILEAYSSPKEFLFPGRWGRGHIHPDSAIAETYIQ